MSDSSTTSRDFTPGSGCKAGKGSHCGNPFHSGALVDRDDGTRSCRSGFARAAKCEPCTDGCGAIVHKDEWHAVNPLAVAQFKAGGIVRPVLTGGLPLFERFFRVVKDPAATVLTPKCAAEIAAGVNAKGRPGYVQTQTREGAATDGAWLPLFVTAAEIKEARRKAAAPIIALIEQIQRGRRVERGTEPVMIDGVRCMPCTTAKNGETCLGNGFGTWETMPAWSWPNGANHFGFCPTCAEAVSSRFESMGMLKDLVTGARQDEAPAGDGLATIGEVAGKAPRARPVPGGMVVWADKSPWDRINATMRLAEGHLSEAGTQRVKDAIQRLRGKSGEKVTHAAAQRIDDLYEAECAALEAAAVEKQEVLSAGHREATFEHSRKTVVRMLKGKGAVDADFKTYSDEECTVEKHETPQELYTRVTALLERRKAIALRDTAIAEAVKLGMYPNDEAAREAFGFDIVEINKAIAEYALTNGGNEDDLRGLPAPAPQVGALRFAEVLAQGGLKVSVARPKANPNDPHYGASRAPVKPAKGGGDKPKKDKPGRGAQRGGGSSREGAVAAHS